MNSPNVIGPRSSMARRTALATSSLTKASVRENPCVDPRPAATVIVAREGGQGVEVLVLRRSQESRFAPGYAVFPGGSIDTGDTDLATRWFGNSEEAARACAVRELAEETGLALTADGLREASGQDALSMVSGAPPSREDLPEISRWIAPEFLRVRFDARFFAVAAPDGLTPRPDGIEIERAGWARPQDVLEEYRLWESLMWPTFVTLEELARCSSVEDVLSLRTEQVPPPVPGI
jgi:recombination protein RecT